MSYTHAQFQQCGLQLEYRQVEASGSGNGRREREENAS